MTELESEFSRILEQMNMIIDLYKRELMPKDEAYSKLFILSREVEKLWFEERSHVRTNGKERS